MLPSALAAFSPPSGVSSVPRRAASSGLTAPQAAGADSSPAAANRIRVFIAALHNSRPRRPARLQNEYLILAATKSRSLTRLYWPAPPYCVYDTSKSHLERRLAPRPAVTACRPEMKLPPGPGDTPVTSCTQVAWGSRFSAPMTLLYSRRPATT